ncbi:SusC/RagA family TonB-linked outer membrane protein [Filimonas lacunae]|uniref:SusC/RagA family TonB-linked outer membrane protein n=1 Tax=Filimonas lacunae TaxID=477680 RepID=UPI0007D7288F|nr:SusC/RagA family TonB-linked outer membrane protein [Filimonas lacunae]BAV07690.1 outer membrane protein SusC, starch binding [Filimonas lacunae]
MQLQNASLEQAFKTIKKITGYSFSYTTDMLYRTRPVTVNVSNGTLEVLLQQCFANQSLTYIIDGQYVIVKEKPHIPPLPTPQTPVTEKDADFGNSDAVVVDITGHVYDEKGNPLTGATVKVMGTMNSVVTDKEGKFVITGAPNKAILEVSFVGYYGKQVKVVAGAELKVFMELYSSELDDVLILAYSTTTKRLATGNVTTIAGSDLEKQPVSNPLLGLQGRVPGLIITQATGLPNSAVTVRIQGYNSLSSGNEPFYVVDGVPYASQLIPGLNTNVLGGNGGNPLNFINPADIESISVLKDADATSIYGSRAANGAIIITTKKGKIGPLKTSFNVQSGWSKVAYRQKLLNTQQYLEMRREAFKNDNLPVPSITATPTNTDYDVNGLWDTARYTDWQKELIGHTARYTTVNANVSGGGVTTQYLVGAGYQRQTTVFPGDLSDNKASLHFNLNSSSLNQRFSMQLTNNFLYDVNRIINTDLTKAAYSLAPNAPAVYKADGTLNWMPNPAGSSTFDNPFAMFERKFQVTTYNFISNLQLRYRLCKQLTIKSSFGYTYLQNNDFLTQPLTALAPELRTNSQRASAFSNSNISSWIIEPQLNWNKGFGRSRVEALVGSTIQKNISKAQQFQAVGFTSDKIIEDIKSATTVSVQGSTAAVYRYNALFGSVNYNYDNKYVVNLNLRRDGSSRFGSENLFHNFGSIAGAWLFSNEEWMKSLVPGLTFGKLKASYGSTGNDQIGDYQFLSLFTSTSGGVGYQSTTGLAATGHTNPYLQWEETKKLQFGLDLGFVKDRILFNVNYFYNSSSNLLQPYALPAITGFGTVTRNFPALVRNYGWEMSLSTVNVKNADFAWSSSLNISIPRNKLVSFPGLDKSSYASRYVIGQPTTISQVYHFLGVDPATGMYQMADSKGLPTTNPSVLTDRTVVLNIAPKYYGGFQNQFSYKSIQLDFLFQFVKQLGYNTAALGNTNSGRFNLNQPVDILQRWQKPGDITSIQKYSTGITALLSTVNAASSDVYVADASFIRLKNVSCSWSVPERWLKRARLQTLRLYAQGQNLFTITRFKGLDPESQAVASLPPLRTMTLGLQLGF